MAFIVAEDEPVCTPCTIYCIAHPAHKMDQADFFYSAEQIAAAKIIFVEVSHQLSGRPASDQTRKVKMNPARKSNVVVVYHSGYGHTKRFAQAVAEGAEQAGANVILTNVEDVDMHWEDLERADAIIFGCPTYMGSASAQFKKFMDDTSHRSFLGQKWKNKVAAGFTNAAGRSGDKLHTLQQLAIFAAQHGMHWVNLGLQAGHNSSTTTEDSLNRHGFFIGAAAQSDADQPAEMTATPHDLATSAHLGARVAMVASELLHGRAALALL